MSIKVTKVEVKPEPPPVKIVIELEGEDAKKLLEIDSANHLNKLCLCKESFMKCIYRDDILDILARIGEQL